jgi:prolyl-tRNA synthetase
MKQSKLFTKTLKDISADETSKNAQLLMRAGFVHKTMAGSYTFLPLGLRVLTKIEDIVRIKMNELGAQEMTMSMLHPSELWKTTGAWDSVDVLFKIKSRTEREYAIGQSEEEVVTPIIKEYVRSYKDLPFIGYQIHWKFRDELRAKAGIMRGREFLMKDMYTIHENQDAFDAFYKEAKEKYLQVYKEIGLVAKATEASGGSFSKKISYEFMVLTGAGEDDILYSETSDYCINSEITTLREGEDAPDGSGKLKSGKASEVGNVFDLGTRYQDAFDFSFLDKNGEKQKGVMGCYGIGVTRIMGVIAETMSDEKGLVWPAPVAPFALHLLVLSKDKESDTYKKAEELYKKLSDQGVEVLFDDRDISAGEKFADSDLIGIPMRAVVSDKSLLAGGVELKERKAEKGEVVSVEAFLKSFEGDCK